MEKTIEIGEQEKEKRKGEIEKILNKFIETWNDKPTAVRLTAMENSASKITEKYFEILTTTIKGQYLSPASLANKFKVAAGTEIACMFILPISIDDPEFTHKDKREINARFAIEAAIQMLYGIHYDDVDQLSIPHATKPSLAPVIYTHLLWLTHLNVKETFSSPTLLAANFWEAYLLASTL